MPFVKLNCNILYSSIWAEDAETCKVWITMLAMADCSGMVAATAPGISRIANIPLEQTEIALLSFANPDEYSKSQDDDGRRIRRVDGGYLILNYDKYRERDNTAYERLKRYRDKNNGLRRNHPLSPVSSASVSVSEYFNIFYKEYPRKIGKHNALKAFTKINPDKDLFDRIVLSLKEQKKNWNDVKFIPHPATWLNGKRWEDEVHAETKFEVGMNRPDQKLTEKQECEREIMQQKAKLSAYKAQRSDRELTKLENDTISNMEKYLNELEKYYSETK